MMKNAAKYFDILTINFVVLLNYFDGPRKSFSDLYLAKFLDSSEQNCSFRVSKLLRDRN